MTWNIRLAALLLAGGSIAGCSSSGDTSDAGSCVGTCCGAECPYLQPDAGPDAALDSGPDSNVTFTCNANPDPCCGHADSATCSNGQTIDAGVDAGDSGFSFACNLSPDPCCGYDAATCPFLGDGGSDASDGSTD